MAESAPATPKKEVRGVEGRVKEMVGKFGNGAKASTPEDAEKRRADAQNAKAAAARYNMVLRGQQIMEKRMQMKKAQGKQGEDFVFQFTDEYEEYPWHLAAAFNDDEDAFWMPELALALEKEDEREINRAILRFFLEENDPERLNEVEDLLSSFAGREEMLFVQLNNEYGSGESNLPADDSKAVPRDEIRSVGTSTVASGGEEEKSPEPLQRRRPSYVVSGLRRDSGWAINAADSELQQRMADSGAEPEAVNVVVAVATANQEPFAPGGTT